MPNPITCNKSASLRRAAVPMNDEQRYRLMLENITDIVYHSVNGNIEWVSPSVSAITGWQPEELIGRSAIHLWHVDDRATAISLRDMTYAGKPGRGVFRFQRKFGDYIWIEVTLQPYSELDGQTGSVGIMRDVNDRVLAERALVASEQQYRLLAENASDVVVHTALSSVIEWVSPSVSALLGWKPDDVVGTSILDFVHPEDLAARSGALAISSQGEASEFEARYRTSAGSYLWLTVTSRPMRNSDGQIIGQIAAARDITEQREAQSKLEYLAFHDPLTGLHNRAWIMDILPLDLGAVERTGASVALLFIDLDQFKVINDSLGHAAGDEMLINIAERIAAVLRPQDRVVRSSGDSFMVVLPDVRDPLEAEHVAERLSAAISTEQEIQGRRTVMTVSTGIAISRPTSTPETLLREADSAMFRAKSAGRNRWQFFDNNMHVEAMTRFTIEGELRQALTRDQFRVWYQPIVDLNDSKIVGHEMLLRWQHPVRGLLAPGEFLSVAEDSGLIIDIGRQVLGKVCAMLDTNSALTGPISINVSAVELTKGNWLAGFKAALAQHSIDPQRLIVELTETALFSLDQTTRGALKELESLGVGLHLDDFGTGFSSISLLQDLPVTGIKLDRRFVDELNRTDNPSDALATGLAGLVKGLNLTGIAEGIETIHQARLLRSIGWEHGQGYHFGRPASEPLLA